MDTFRKYLRLSWFKVNPLDLPRSIQFFRYNLVFYFVLELFILFNVVSFHEAIFEVILETILTLSFSAIIVFYNHKNHSYVQVATSVLFCENVVAAFGVPTIFWLTNTYDIFSIILTILLIIWDFALISFIMKKVLGINVKASLSISILYFFFTYVGAVGITALLF